MTVFSMTSAPVYLTGKSLLLSDSLLLPTKNYAWGVSFGPLLAQGVSVLSPSSLSLGSEYLDPEEEETSDQLLSVLNKLALPLWSPDMEKMWPGYETAGQLSGSEGLEQQSSWAAEFSNQVTLGISTIDNNPFFQSHNFPIDLFLSESYNNCKLEICSPVFRMNQNLELEIELECGVSVDVDSGSVEPVLSSTLDATLVSTDIHHDITTQTTLVDHTTSLDSIIGDQPHDIITDDNPTNAEP